MYWYCRSSGEAGASSVPSTGSSLQVILATATCSSKLVRCMGRLMSQPSQLVPTSPGESIDRRHAGHHFVGMSDHDYDFGRRILPPVDIHIQIRNVLNPVHAHKRHRHAQWLSLVDNVCLRPWRVFFFSLSSKILIRVILFSPWQCSINILSFECSIKFSCNYHNGGKWMAMVAYAGCRMWPKLMISYKCLK